MIQCKPMKARFGQAVAALSVGLWVLMGCGKSAKDNALEMRGMSASELFQAKSRCTDLGKQFYESAKMRSGWAPDEPEYVYSPRLNTCLYIGEYDAILAKEFNWHGQLVVDLLTNSVWIGNRMPMFKEKWTGEHKSMDERYQFLRSALLEDSQQLEAQEHRPVAQAAGSGQAIEG